MRANGKWPGRRRQVPPISADTDTDIVVIGAGHNGLVAAAYLARAGFRVTVVEAREDIGGPLWPREFAAGFTAPMVSPMLGRVPARLVRDLDLHGHGLRFAKREVPTFALVPDQEPLRLGADRWATADGIRARSAIDAARYPDLVRHRNKLARALRALGHRMPRPLDKEMPGTSGVLPATIEEAVEAAQLSAAEARQFLKLLMRPIGPYLDEMLTLDALKGALALPAVLGHPLRPSDIGTGLTWLQAATGDLAGAQGSELLAEGGIESFVRALAKSATSADAIIRTGIDVTRVATESDGRLAVSLADGSRILASRVVSAINPVATCLELIGVHELGAELVRDLRHVRHDGVAARLTLALSRLPQIGGVAAEEMNGRFVFAPSLPMIETAQGAVHERAAAQLPILEIAFPTARDAQYGPVGTHVLAATVQAMPYDIAGGWERHRQGVFDRCIDTLIELIPDLAGTITGGELMVPPDMERLYRLPRGDWHHGSMTLDQSWAMRPVPRLAQYRAPLKGLYLASAGVHPGGGITGEPGYMAARCVLADLAADGVKGARGIFETTLDAAGLG